MLNGISEALGIDFYKAFLANYFVEIDSFCSSAIVRLPSGELVNVRNTDYYTPKDYQLITYFAKWERNSTHIFTSLNGAGVTGVYSAVKEGKFSVSFNSRKDHGRFD